MHPGSVTQIFVVGSWVEAVLYGINCSVFGFCMFVLMRGEKAKRPWVLIISSTILMILCTVHVALSLRQQLEAFVYAPGCVPNYSDAYYLNITTMMGVKDLIYVTLVFMQDNILIWRAYVVYNSSWKVVAFPLLVEAAAMATAYAAGIITMIRRDVITYLKTVAPLGVAAWTFDLLFNVWLTVAIAGRLWWMGRAVAPLAASKPNKNQYKATANIIIGSGSLFTCMTIIIVVLFAVSHEAIMAANDIAPQIAALTPLLIVVKVGLKSAGETTDQVNFRDPEDVSESSRRNFNPQRTQSSTTSTLPDLSAAANEHFKM